MSMSFDELLCNRCEFRSASSRVWGHFDYVVAGERFPVDRQLGWCHDCADFQPIERFGQVAERERAVGRTERAVAAARQGIWRRLGLLIGIGRRRLVELGRKHGENAFALQLARQRTGDERCLGCGSPNVEKLALPQQAGPTGFRHPQCGGEIYIRPSDIRLHMAFAERLYTEDGMPLP